MSIEKLKNWKQAVDIDYLSLYIKTWFAFLSSLKQLHPNITSKVGDGALIKHHLNNLDLPYNYDTDIKSHIKKAYSLGQMLIKRDLGDSYFGRYYSINKEFRFSIPSNIGHAKFKIEYKNKLNGKKVPNLFVDFTSTQAQFFKKFKQYHFSLNIPIETFLAVNIYDSRDKCVSHVIDHMRLEAFKYIDNIPQLQAAGINSRRAYIETILTLISQQWRPNFKSENLFQPLPVVGFPDSYDEHNHKIVVVKWFIRFTYDLRNILFHHIIDPFDEDWLRLFRHTYLGLKEIVNNNIDLINRHSIT